MSKSNFPHPSVLIYKGVVVGYVISFPFVTLIITVILRQCFRVDTGKSRSSLR